MFSVLVHIGIGIDYNLSDKQGIEVKKIDFLQLNTRGYAVLSPEDIRLVIE